MKNILVSIIVPVYNSSKYITNCIESLINQTYKNVEIVFINDGSTDNSLNVLNAYKRDKRIKIINQKNQGANIARTNGLKKCKGDYVMFVDSDDTILPNTVFELIELIRKYNVDIIKFRFINYDNGNIESNYYKDKGSLLKELLTTSKMNNITNEIVSAKVIRLDDDVFDIKSSNAEDLLMNLSFYDHANNIMVVDDAYYFYTSNENSTSKTVDIKRILSSIKEYDLLLDVLLKYAKKWNLNDSKLINLIYFRNITSLCLQVIRIIEYKDDNETLNLINESLDRALIYNHDYKKIIYQNEKHYLNKRIYLDILNRHYKRTKLLLLVKNLAKAILK